ncbi:MAG: flotillin family protein [Chloroflexi bacterium]|jgi:flotillin|nr:flotillin family protein [Chloroflexota bacterium]
MPPEIILAFILALIVIAMFMTLVSRYKRCPSNKILVIYGKTGKGVARTIHGGAAFVWPLFQDYSYLDLEPFVVPIELTNALSRENIRVSVPTTITAAISTEEGLMQNAAVRLLGLTQEQIRDQAQDIILGQMRAVIATMAIEEINRDRQAFMSKVNEAVSTELEKVGLSAINVNIRDIQDESGYIVALGRKAAAEAVNQAQVDVAEQERIGQSGVAERERDRRRAVAAAEAAAIVGEKEAERDRRRVTSQYDAEAVQAESESQAKRASYMAQMQVAEQEARRMAEEAARMADGAIRAAEERAQRDAELARAEREQARLQAEVVVPANAQRDSLLIEAEAERQRRIKLAQGEAEAILMRMQAEAQGSQAILEAKAKGYEELVKACGDPAAASAFLMIEKLLEVAGVQAEAIKNLPLEKIVVWDSGDSQGGLSNLGKRLMGVVPPMHELARLTGLELPDFLGKLQQADGRKVEATIVADGGDLDATTGVVEPAPEDDAPDA